MNLVTVENLSKQFSERVLLDQVNLQINAGDRIGLIGLNGSGKTTLLRMLAGLETPDSGSITVWGGVRLQYLSQIPELNDELTVLEQLYASPSPRLQLLLAYEKTSRQLARNPSDPDLQRELHGLTEEMTRQDAWAAEAQAKAILSRLGIQDFDALIGTLSGGQRKRVALGRVLLDPADLLILDEPTNHIDAQAITWLEGYLVTLSGALLMVTHDPYYLERVVNRIVELDRRSLAAYAGNYSRYLELRARREEHLAAVERKRRVQLRRELEWLRKGVMARGTKQKARKQRAAELQVIRHDLGEDRVVMALTSTRLGKKVLDAKSLSHAFGDVEILHDVNFSLEPGERIGIVGPNGAGKSTLLNILSEQLKADSGLVEWGTTVQLAYYDQQAEYLQAAVAQNKRIIEFIEDVAPLVHTPDGDRVDAAQMLEWFLFPRPLQHARISVLSGGERRRLYLLYILAQRPNVIFLDEPTNDLDLQTLQVLEEYLDHFSGSLVVVTHDRYFLDRNVDYIQGFTPADRRNSLTARLPSPYETFKRLLEENTSTDEPEGPASEKHRTPRPAQARKRLSYLEQREFDQLEERIEEIETRLAALEVEMAAHASEYSQLQALLAEKNELEPEHEAALARWLELSEKTT
jgi:ATP-binding cassette subfamily F protein uup